MPKIIVFPFRSYLQSPIGIIEIQATQHNVHSVRFLDKTESFKQSVDNEVTQQCVLQLTEYFDGKRKDFSVSTQQEGTDFMQGVWVNVCDIPYGKTASYLDLAKLSGDENLTRAVGTANGKNQLAILVPCHRVIGTNGKLTGYAWGLHRKQWLLDHEAKVNNTYSKLF
ncbi:MAG: methylated-DNA--[protein]-cysteine S-methyltransferase [Bacteroidota bacterium]